MKSMAKNQFSGMDFEFWVALGISGSGITGSGITGLE